jgi:hypothetical protein
MFKKKGGGSGVRCLMQLEEAYAVEITKLVEYVDSKEDPPIQVVRTHRHNINSTILRTARHLKTELQRGTGETKDSVEETTKKVVEGRGCINISHVT